MPKQTSTRKHSVRTSSSGTRRKSRATTWPRWKVWLCVLAAGALGFIVADYLAKAPTSGTDYLAGIHFPSDYDIRGIDISHYQGLIDWERLSRSDIKGAPVSFVILKATEGTDRSDEFFQRNFMRARRSKIIRGAYHFFRPTADIRQQADFFIQTAALEPGDLPPILDIETDGGLTKDELRRRAKQWLDRIEREYNVKPIIYTGLSFKRTYLNTADFNDYPLWIAHYNVDTLRYDGQWVIWQHTDAGHIDGINGRVDLNLFNGTRQDLRDLTIPNPQD